MSRSRGPAYTPDGVTAADATVAASEKSEAAEGLVRGEDVRVAVADALIHASETDDEADTGSQVPVDATERAKGLARVYRHVRRHMGVEGEDPREGQEGAQPRGPEGDAPANEDVVTANDKAPSLTGGTPEGGVPNASTSRTNAGRAHEATQTARNRASGMARPSGKAQQPSKGRPMGSWGTSMTPDARAGTVGKGSRSMTREGLTSRTTARRQPHARHLAARSTGRGAIAATSTASGAATSTGAAATVAAPVAAVVAAIVVLFLLVLAILAGGATDEDQRAGAHRLAQTATDEYLEGEARGDYNHKGLPYSACVRGAHGGKDDWDVCLVTWCMGKAGFVQAGLVGKYSDVTSYLAHFRHNPELGEVHDWNGDPYTPVEGDLFVVPYTDGTSHMGIVTSCDGTFFQTVEGDVAGGPDGLYDRDEEDGHGGYVACRTRRTNQYSYTFIHLYYSEEAVTKP